MIITCVYISVRPENTGEFIRATILNHRETRKEPGNIRFDFIRQEGDPNKFMLYEVFESDEAIAAHKKTSHYLAWRDTVQDMMAEQRYGIRHSLIAPDRKEW